MWVTRISLDLYGDNFSPKELLKQLEIPHVVFSSNEPTDLKFTGREEPYGFGSLSLLAPEKLGLQCDIVTYENWYLSTLEKYHVLFKKCGVTEINLFMDVFFTDQFNSEIFSREGISKLGKYKVAIPISVYKITEAEILELLDDAGFSKGRIAKFIIETGN